MSAATRPELGNPFPGLRPFKDNEEHIFFGRASKVDMMIERLAQKRYLAVVVTSGSGYRCKRGSATRAEASATTQ